MEREKIALSFAVALTDYGWSVELGGKRLDLFQTQQQALAEVKRRRASLKSQSESSVISAVSGGRSNKPRVSTIQPVLPKR